MTLSTGVGRGHGRHHHGPRAKKPTAMGATSTTAMPPSVKPVKSKGVGRGHGKHHHGPDPKAHHPHKKKVK
jgi:hypothetical protein